MNVAGIDLHLIWAGVVGFALIMYALFDGFDLGVGILLPTVPQGIQRTRMLSSILPVWDGNETWIVLAGVGLYGGFPEAYSILLPALYVPLISMILSLALRGVSMEFHYNTHRTQRLWDVLFSVGSWGAAISQGIIVGALLEGIRVAGRRFAGGPLDFLTPFSVLTGLTLPVVYALAGVAWLHLKTQGRLQQQMRRYGLRLSLLVALLFVGVGLGRHYWSLFSPESALLRQTDTLTPIRIGLLLLTFGALLVGRVALRRGQERRAMGSILLTVTSAASLVLAMLWPYIVPFSVTIQDAGSPHYGQSILLSVTLIVIPIILIYLGYAYYVFRGKVSNDYELKLNEQGQKQPQPSSASNHPLLPPPSPIRLPWPARLGISVLGIAVFFGVIGPLGETFSWLFLVAVIVIFVYAWWRHEQRTTDSDVAD